MSIPKLDERTLENMEPFFCKNCALFPDKMIGTNRLVYCPKMDNKVFDDSDKHYWYACMERESIRPVGMVERIINDAKTK